ncbi:NYN domain-containing protein [Bacillus sp. S/N-304-OC-R1]|uniref:LabA-like NYN domain-containing protein n=1 Tax=Bacillus sp. S/N-304-OC-R1 TaxID=2758034 RepID=UPI0021AFD6B3|nr:NYN domain-containing protein [Bacillus sp. S/N-304-OC-R1]MBY0124503.1 NYN domain-containing protein [Bacillus sp. S/N-304-OC-R1]
MKRVMIFIDGNNFESAVNNLMRTETRVDYSKLANLVTQKRDGRLVRFYYYTAAGAHDKPKAEATKKFVHFLNTRIPNCTAKLGFIKVLGKDAEGKPITTEKETDVNIAVDMVKLAYTNAYDEAIILSADSDYRSAIDAVRNFGKNVTVCSVDQQSAGFLKDLCDDNMKLTAEDITSIKR